jgi:Peptidase family M1 domain
MTMKSAGRRVVTRPSALACSVILAIAFSASLTPAQSQDKSSESMAIYQGLAKFQLSGASARAENSVLKRDRAQMTFSGTFYFDTPAAGKIRGAVFIGSGSVHADAPNSTTEQDNLRRMLHADAIDATFKTAVLRFSDDTMEALGLQPSQSGTVPDDAQKLATEFSRNLLRETGANVPARVAVSILNQESPGFFIAEFDKGSRGRFDLLLDDQGRVPVANFELNGGEKGLFFAYDTVLFSPDVWMAFYSQNDYASRRVEYSDAHALVDISRYDMDIDVRDWKHMRLEARMHMTALADGVRAIPLMINGSLSGQDDERLKKALRLKDARIAGGAPLDAIQEDWDGCVTLLLATPLHKAETLDPVLTFEGEYLFTDDRGLADAHYLRGDDWYPRHVDLQRSQFDLTFHHKKDTRVASIGQKIREETGNGKDMVTEWRMDQPVPFATFAVGDFQVFSDKIKMESGSSLDLDFYRVPASLNNYGGAVKTDFMLAEMNNCIRYFSALFGPYPYPRFGATYHPFPYGQGFPSMLFLPKSDFADRYTFSFIAHETSHQWWGNVVAWRSYRDQWLSEGFADYSGVLYTGLRDKDHGSTRDLIRRMHDELLETPRTLTGLGQGRLADIGPIILGQRLNTRESFGAYEALIYKKGALVLRMLHFLFTDPDTNDDKPFFDMMKDFVSRYANRSASTEDFIGVANEHFATTAIARIYQMKDLNWFFRQWVYGTALPSYEFSYWIERLPDGTAMVHGTVAQRNAPANWLMPLPLAVRFGKDKISRGIVMAAGPERPATIHVPAAPENVELDPDHWVLAEKTSTTTVAPPKK